jgi:hypothetical protein
VQLCPVNCIPVNPAFVESPAQLRAKFHRLQAEKPSGASSPASLTLQQA